MQNNLSTRKKGAVIEEAVSGYLKNKGYTILERNYICHFGEIDIIAKEKEYIVFIEVKYRKNAAFGYPEEAVDTRKQKKLLKTALFYIRQNHISIDNNYRFDVVSVTGNKVKIIKNAF